MKTTFKTYSTDQAKNKAREYSARYGVKFDFYHTGNGYRVVPVISAETASLDSKNPANDKVYFSTEFGTRFGKSFSAIADETKLPIATVLSAALYLIKNGLVRGDCDRLGNIAGIHPKGK